MIDRFSIRLTLVTVGITVLAALGCGNNGGGASPDAGTGNLPDSSTAGTDAPNGDVAITTPGSSLVLDQDSLTVVEGDPLGGTLVVRLAKPFPAPVTVNVTTSDRTVATAAQDTLVFPANDTAPMIVTVLGTHDDDTVPNSTLLTLSGPDVGTVTVHITVTDVDKQAIVAAPTQVFMQQGESTQVGIRLAFRPSSPITVTVVSPNPALTVSPTTVTFADDSTYSIAQPVTLTAILGGAVGDQIVTLSVSAAEVATVLPIPVTITDPNTLSLLVTPATLDLIEGGTPGTFAVSLTKAPPTPLSVSITSSNSARALPGPVGITFDATNYSVPQVITVTPQANNDPKDETATITVAVTTAIVPTVAPRTVTVNVASDEKQAIDVLPTSVTVNAGASTTFDVWMAFSPSSSVTVNAFSSNPARITVTPPTLIFNPTNFGTHQKVTVQGLPGDDLSDIMANITLTSVAANSVTVPVTLKNTNAQAIQVVYATSPGSIVMQETQAGGPASTTTFGVNLAYNPAADLQVTLASDDDTRLSISKSFLTFNPTGGAAPGKTTQFVTLTALHDADIVDNAVKLTVSAPGLPSVVVTVTILDMDVERLTISKTGGTAPITSLSQKEGDTGVSFDVGLSLTPPSPVTVTLTSSDGTRASVSTPITLSSTTAVTVPVTLPVDLDADLNVVTITLHATPDSLNIPDRSITITIADANTQAIVVAKTLSMPLPYPSPSIGLTVHERSAPNTDSFWVALNAQPDGQTKVNLSISPPTPEITLSAASLTFETGTWNVPQEVTVTGKPDSNLSTDQFNIDVSAPGLGVSDQFVSVTDIDDDTQMLNVSTASITGLKEDGTIENGMPQFYSAQFGVSLALQPLTSTTVTVTVPPDATSSFGVAPASSGSCPTDPSVYKATLNLTFSSSGTDYATPQVLCVTALNDANTDSEMTSISVSLPAFAGSQPVVVTDIDGDRQVIQVVDNQTCSPMPCPTPYIVTEPAVVMEAALNEWSQSSRGSTRTQTRTFNVTLKYPPHGGQIENIAIMSSDSTHASVSMPAPPSLSFSGTKDIAGGFNVAQTFTVLSAVDADPFDEDVTFMLSTDKTGGGWSAATQVIPLHIYDLDAGITVSPLSATVTQNGMNNQATFTVTVTQQPAATISVSIPNPDPVHLAVSATSLTFTPTSWMTNPSQTFTVMGQPTGEMTDHDISMNLGASGALFVTPANTTASTQELQIKAAGM